MGVTSRARRANWRYALEYEALAHIDRAGLMWERLRRDPGYIAWQAEGKSLSASLFERISRRPATGDPTFLGRGNT